MPFWARKHSNRSKLPTATPDQNSINSPLLRLPGELRNLIYSYTIYPSLNAVIVSHETQPHQFGKTVLSLPLFRVSHQVRAEALSYLVTNKRLRICGYDAAAAFLECIGPAARNVKALTIAQPFIWDQKVQLEPVDRCIHYLDQASDLAYIRIEHGMVNWPEEPNQNMKFFDQRVTEKWNKFMEDKEHVHFGHGFGSYDSKSPYYGSVTGRAGSMLDVMDPGSKVVFERNVMYLY
ncbi:hypothetical protein FB567DRAFT_149296 [Paraphoma chrysanthemicola]|uniref:Uncharacterized protein n=1 Tax=Paraphoma chrysanthemicola TaxID=798071 RepID=A0A8K0VUH9_9PLEO|nr:hypothetical protein FB567DRAFT_149296 [Paraphoma chrysanthemicola]